MYQKSLSLLILTLFLSVVGCQSKAPIPIFETLPPGKNPNVSSRFQLIDDYTDDVGKKPGQTRIETEWQMRSSGGATVQLIGVKADAVGRHGGALAVHYTIPPKGNATLFTVSKVLDMSQAQYLVLLLRAEEYRAFPGKIMIELSDTQGTSKMVDVKSYLRPWKNGTWLEAAIPRAVFNELDFEQLSGFYIDLTNAQNRQISGKLVIDEVGFFGPEDLVFKSAADNLKGFPKKAADEARTKELLATADEKAFLLGIARDTWRYFDQLVDTKTGLPVDHVRLGDINGIGSYISPSNLALYWLVCVGAADLSLISKDEAIRRIETTFQTLPKMERWDQGLFHNYYHTRSLGATRRFVSSVDNGWLAAAFAVVRQAYPEPFGKRATEFLDAMDFSKFYDPKNGQLKLGFDADTNSYSPYHYGLLVSEARIASYVGIGKGDLEKQHWARIYRTLPAEWEWQKQVPKGFKAVLFGAPVFEGHYSYRGRQFVPSWGGSLFEFLAPTLVLNEQKLAPDGLGKNNGVATDLSIEYALQEMKYPVWGISPCAIQNGRQWLYQEYGVPPLSAKGYAERGVITPHATFLALATRPGRAVKNLRKLLALYPDIYGEYGFYDSVRLEKGYVNHQYLILDQAMSFVALTNYLKDGAIRNLFHQDSIGKGGEELLTQEQFFPSRTEGSKK